MDGDRDVVTRVLREARERLPLHLGELQDGAELGRGGGDSRADRQARIRPQVRQGDDERGRVGKTYRGSREGLRVVTPSAGTYLQFDGRDSEEDIVARDPQQVIDRINEVYRRQEPLEIGFFLRIEPLLITRYEAGGTLVVSDVRIERDRVRLSFSRLADDSPAGQLTTGLTVQWPTLLSPSLTERPLIDALIRQFVDDTGSKGARD